MGNTTKAVAMPMDFPVAVSEDLLTLLSNLVAHRDVPALSELLRDLSEIIDNVDPTTPNGARLMGRMGVAADLGCLDLEQLGRLLLRFPACIEAALPGSHIDCIRLGFGIYQFLSGDTEPALRDFNYILNARYEKDPDLIILSRFFKARCERVLGQINTALNTVREASAFAETNGRGLMGAAIRIFEARLTYNLGKRDAARRLLKDSWRALEHTNDYVSQANILGDEGRMARRAGKYSLARRTLESAVRLWRNNNCRHRYLARDLTQLALVKILDARRREADLDTQHKLGVQRKELERRCDELRDKFHAMVAESESAPILATPDCLGAVERWLVSRIRSDRGSEQQRQIDLQLNEIERIRSEARAHLMDAESIYQHPFHARGSATVLTYDAMLDIDTGEYDAAHSKVSRAREFAAMRDDNVALARVGIVWGSMSLDRHALAEACSQADDAWTRAEQTQNLRLKGRAATLCARCAKEDGDIAEAKRWRDRGFAFLKRDGSRDYAWEELVALNRTLNSSEAVEQIAADLHAKALLGEMPLGQITNRFEEVIVLAVHSENPRIKVTAKRLGMGEKKVREILRRLGLNTDELK